MLIPLKAFTGEFPRTPAYLLPPTGAQLALDCDFLRGSLTGIRTRDPVANLTALSTAVKSIFVYDGGASAGTTYVWDRDVDSVRSPVPNDAYGRFLWSDGTKFCVSQATTTATPGEPGNKYMLGVPRPEAALTAATPTFTIAGYTADATPKPVYDLSAPANVSFTLYNEHTDGSLTEPQTVTTPTPTITASSASWGFSVATAPAAPTNTGVASTTGTTTTTGATSSSVVTDTTNNTTPVTSGNTTYDSGGITSSTTSNSTTPSNTNSTTSLVSPNIGPVLKMVLTRYDGVQTTVMLRTDSNKSVIPPEFATLVSSFNISNVVCSVLLGANVAYMEDRAYSYTYVNNFGEEGPPAPPIDLQCARSSTVTLTIPAPPGSIAGFDSGNMAGYKPATKVRIYRTATGGGLNYLFVAEWPLSGGLTFVDKVPSGSLAEPISTLHYYPPPQDLRGICLMANGILAGFRSNEIWFSEPYLPYAWNPSYAKPLMQAIVGICPFENGVYVTTLTNPYFIMGASPDTMTDAKVPVVQAGVSKNSIVNMGAYVMYASNDGLVAMRGLDASLDESFRFFTRNQWRDRYAPWLPFMRLNQHDGSLVGWILSTDPAAPAGFLLRFEEEALSYSQLTERTDGAFVYPVADQLYMAQSNSVFVFKGGASTRAFTWWSKDFVQVKPTNFGAVQVVGTGGSITLSSFVDGVLKYTMTFALADTGLTIKRLPAGFLGRKWSFKVVGSAGVEIQEMTVATSITELQGV